jgi:hypothetical protein
VYLSLETYERAEVAAEDHGETDEERAAALRALAGLGEVADAARLAASSRRGVEVCSCGHFTCGLIGRYGLPVPTFKDDVEPLFPQSRRDRRALEIRGGA